MNRTFPKVLIISSCKLSQGPAIIAGQYYDALCRYGIETDLLLKYPDPRHPEFMYAVDESYEKSFLFRLRKKYLWLRFYKWKPVDLRNTFFYTKEKYPPIPSRCVVNKINKKYDLVLIVFWQGLLSFETIQRIYDKLHCQIHFMAVDYSPMSGGCHFTGDCDHFMTGCGMCPAFLSSDKNDFTAWNVRYRERVYKKVAPIVYGNQYMTNYYKRSFLLKDANCEIIPSVIINTDLFRPLDPIPLKIQYQIPTHKKSVLFFACQNLNDKRKGFTYLMEALMLLYQRLGDKAHQVLVITAGNGYLDIKGQIPFDSLGFGYVPLEKLPELFALSTCFLCSSIDDAGPMMVNQSLCCGTPVVGFEMGSVLQVVKNRGTGYAVPLKDSSQMADAIYRMINVPKTEYIKMCMRCREVALQSCSYKSHVDFILSVFNKYQEVNSEKSCGYVL